MEECAVCGRSYKGEGPAVFNREKGTISCLKCHQPSALSPQMKPGSVKALNTMQTQPIAESKTLSLPEETLVEIRTVLRLHREYRLEKKLKTAKYVE